MEGPDRLKLIDYFLEIEESRCINKKQMDAWQYLAQEINSLGSELYDLLRADNSIRKNMVLFLLTSDASAYPRVALLSPYQILANDKEHLFISIYRGSKSNKNLREKKKATLVVVTPPSVRYVRISGEAFDSPDIDSNEQLFEFRIEEERSDFSPDAPIISSILFDERKIKERYEKSFARMLKASRDHE
jgi:hypothetical protein